LMPNPIDLPKLLPAQMEIMNVVWDAPGGATVVDVWKALAARRPIARNTVQTTLVRLEQKGWLSHHTEGSGFRYFARRQRDSTLGRIVGKLVDTAFGGAADGMVFALLQGRGVSKEEAARIRVMIEDAERNGQ
jgi:BlaI family transcriptional regulator, penicillinase repressor